MAQLTIYLNNETLKKIEAAATEDNLSVSKWVCQKLENTLKHEWPVAYFSLFGALKDSDLHEADEIDFIYDGQREKF